jgi:putative membrane protein insertion efficiency factor
MTPITRWPAEVLVAPIRFYQRFITPYTPPSCRYYPTCSAYAVTALRTRGAVVGTVLTIWRLLRCNPWSTGGIDHVPATGLRREPPGTTGRSSDDPTGPRAEPVPGPESGSVPGSAATSSAGDPADLSSGPPSRCADTTIRRSAA